MKTADLTEFLVELLTKSQDNSPRGLRLTFEDDDHEPIGVTGNLDQTLADMIFHASLEKGKARIVKLRDDLDYAINQLKAARAAVEAECCFNDEVQPSFDVPKDYPPGHERHD